MTVVAPRLGGAGEGAPGFDIFEYIFEYVHMVARSASATAQHQLGSRSEVLAGLRDRIGQMQGASAPEPGFALHAMFAPMLPGGVLKHGAVYAVPHGLHLALALAGGPSAAGAWCAVVGLPDAGVEAAIAAGVDGDRLVVVPRPGTHALAVVSALIDVIGVVIVGPGLRVSPAEHARLAARLRERSASLIVVDEWTQTEAVLRTMAVRWQGIGHGWGSLGAREVDVAVETRGQGARQARWSLRFDASARPVLAVPSTAANRRGQDRHGQDRLGAVRFGGVPRAGAVPSAGGVLV